MFPTHSLLENKMRKNVFSAQKWLILEENIMIFPGGMNKITSHQLHEKFSDLKLVRRELPIVYSLQLAAWGQFQKRTCSQEQTMCEETWIFQCFMMEYEFPNTYLRCVSKTWILTSTASSVGSDRSHEKFAVIRDWTAFFMWKLRRAKIHQIFVMIERECVHP